MVASRGLGPFLGDGQGPGFCGLRDPVSSEQGCALLQSVGPMDSKRVGSAYLYFSIFFPKARSDKPSRSVFGSLGANEDVPHGPLFGIDALMPELCQSRFRRVLETDEIKKLMQSKFLGHVFRRCSFSLRLFHRCIRMQGQESTYSSKIKLPPMLRTRKKKRIHWPGLKRQGDVSLHRLHIQACTCTVW